MTRNPKISVVMSVYNDTEYLRESVESVISQEGVDFEFIIVNDGSTDGSGSMLDEYSRSERRIRVIHQENTGLTRALIRGCSEARGEYIARQDAGDIALTGKFKKLLTYIEQHPEASLVSCGTRFVAPHGEFLYDASIDPEKAQSHLLTLNIKEVQGVSSHGSVLFRKSVYEEVGGYRSEFYFAQDLDLWIRMSERGKHAVIQEVLHQTQFTPDSISGYHRKGQVKLTKIMLECARLRRGGLSEQIPLEKARAIRPATKRHNNRFAHAGALYFIGTCLRKQGNTAANIYFRKAINIFPLHFKSLIRLLF